MKTKSSVLYCTIGALICVLIVINFSLNSFIFPASADFVCDFCHPPFYSRFTFILWKMDGVGNLANLTSLTAP